MTLSELLDYVRVKTNFSAINDYSCFCEEYLSFVKSNLQAIIVSKNETIYIFFQYKNDGNFNVTRPINSKLMLTIDNFEASKKNFIYAMRHINDVHSDNDIRYNINAYVYTCQQAIGAALDALPANTGNVARKIHGDLFERFIRLILLDIGISVRDGIVHIPISIDDEMFNMSYQHDIIIENGDEIKAVGSVKTSSKDRIDKIFIDKFLHNRLLGIDIPHFAVFLQDVQRKGRAQNYTVGTTFLTGHFKGYTVKLNPLDGVYYCDPRPVMKTDSLLRKHIHTLDHLLVEDIWTFHKPCP